MKAQHGIRVAGAVLILAAAGVRANEANYQHYILGDRAAGMGGAACASASGVEAVYYNPAGLAATPRDSVSLSANLYGIQEYSAENAFMPGEDFQSRTFQSIPSSVGGTKRAAADWVLGFGVFVPFRNTIFDGATYAADQHYYSVAINDQTMLAGPAVGWQVNPRLALGCAVLGLYQSYDSLMNFYWGDAAVAYTRDMSYSNFGLIGALGAQFQVNDRLRLGATLTSPCQGILGKGQVTDNAVGGDEAGGSRGEVADYQDLDAENGMPGAIRIGVAWGPERKWQLAADATYHFSRTFKPLSGRTPEGEPVAIEQHCREVLDFSLGGEHYLRGKYPVRAGFFTSRSAAPDPVADNTDEAGQIDLYGLTATVGVEMKNAASNIGLNYLWGPGRAIGWGTDAAGEIVNTVSDSDETHLYVVFNTQYYF